MATTAAVVYRVEVSTILPLNILFRGSKKNRVIAKEYRVQRKVREITPSVILCLIRSIDSRVKSAD